MTPATVTGQSGRVTRCTLTEHVEMPVGSYIDYQGQRYTLWRPEDLTKHVTEPVYQLDDNG